MTLLQESIIYLLMAIISVPNSKRLGFVSVLGAFIAGMLLADSEYRHGLEADIAPFKDLLLGLFFIAAGMSVNINLLLEQHALQGSENRLVQLATGAAPEFESILEQDLRHTG